jgi:hypothetical protein
VRNKKIKNGWSSRISSRVLYRVDPEGNLANLARVVQQRRSGISGSNHYCYADIWYGPGNTFCTGQIL